MTTYAPGDFRTSRDTRQMTSASTLRSLDTVGIVLAVVMTLGPLLATAIWTI